MRLKGLIVIVISLISSITSLAQVDSVKYQIGFRFIDGIYSTYEEFKNNSPSIRYKAIISDNPEVQFLFGHYAKMEEIAYYDSSGLIQKLNRNDVWGYSTKGFVYVLHDYGYYKLLKIGSIIYFMEVITPISSSNMVPLSIKTHKQYLIDFATGELLGYNLFNIQYFLKKDPELFEEFNSLKRKSKMKKHMFAYLIKFNERNPVYFRTTPN